MLSKGYSESGIHMRELRPSGGCAVLGKCGIDERIPEAAFCADHDTGYVQHYFR